MIDNEKLQAWVFAELKKANKLGTEREGHPQGWIEYYVGYGDALCKLLEHLDKEHDIPATDNWLLY